MTGYVLTSLLSQVMSTPLPELNRASWLPGLAWAGLTLLWFKWRRPRSRRGATLAGVLGAAFIFTLMLAGLEVTTAGGGSWRDLQRYLTMPLFFGFFMLPVTLPAAWALQQMAFRRRD